jgi:CubicO group peptidase (beta-lactamase class C family)
MEIKTPKTAYEMELMHQFPPPSHRKITLANWLEGPPVRWSFMHACELVPSAEAHRGYRPRVELPRHEQELDAILFSGINQEDLTICDMLTRTYTDGFLVIHQGKIIKEQYFNGMQPHYRHLLQSVSKSLTSILAAVFIHKGVLDPKAVCAEYLTELKGCAYGDATLQQLLDMTVSVEYTEDYGNINAHITIHETAAGWRRRSKESAHIPESQYEFFPTLQHQTGEQHGDRFHYVSANTDILGWILERVTKTRFTELFGKEIWQYMGARENAAMLVDPWGAAAASGGFNITLRDLGLFGLLMLNQGHHNGRQIIPQAYIEDTLTNGDNAAWLKGKGDWLADFYPRGSYRNQFWVTGNDHGAYFCVGIHGQYVYIDPKADVVIVKLSSLPQAIVEFAEGNTLLGFEAIIDALI